MAAGTLIKHKRKAGGFVNGELAAGEWGVDVTNSAWYYSINGTTVVQLMQAGIPTSEKGAANGVATLDSGGKLPSSQLPLIAVTNVNTVGSQAAQLALTAQEGDVAVRTDLGKTYIHNSGNAGTMADWSEMTAPGVVATVFGRTGAVVATLNDYATSLINNDSNVSGATAKAALETLNAGKAPSSHAHSAADITSGTLSNATVTIDGGTI